MGEIVVVFVYAVYILVNFTLSVIDIAGASLYDFQLLKMYKRLRLERNAGKRLRRPMVSVIIPAFNEAPVIERCVKSVLNSKYGRFEVVVSDDGSLDDTYKIVSHLISTHPDGCKVQLISDGVNRGRGGALNQALAIARGDLVYAVDADCVIEEDTIIRAVWHMQEQNIEALASNVKIMPHMSLLGLLQQFEWIVSFRSKKFNSVSNAEYIVGGAGAMYRTSILRQLGGFNESMLTEDIDMSLRIVSLGNKSHKIRYASDVLVLTEHVPTYTGLFKQRYRWKLGSLQALYFSRSLFFTRKTSLTKMLTWYRLPLVIWGEIMLLLEPLFLTYFVYLAIALHTPVMFIVSWAALMLTLFFVIWGDDNLTTVQKIRFTMFMPIMYFLYYVLSFMQIVAMFKALFNYRKIRGLDEMRGTWVSPNRVA